MKRCPYKSFNQKTSKVEQFINDTFRKKNHPMKDVSSVNVKILASALMDAYHKEYCIDFIDLLSASTGIMIEMKLDALDDWKDEEMNHSTKDWLYKSLKNIIEVLGNPTEVFESEGSFYAEWTRNIVTWF